MTSITWVRWIAVLGAAVAIGGCGRVDVYAITKRSAGGASGGGTSVPGGSAGAPSLTPACPASPLAAGNTTRTVQVGSVNRTYLLHVPPAYDGSEPVPLVLDLHATGDTGRDELSSSPYPPVTDPEGVVMAFPNGLSGPLGTSWNMGPCCVADVDDLAFARVLVSDIESVACIDPDRVYVVGVLAGGGMAYHLACQAADLFAAVASAASDLLQETVNDCRPSRPITVISFRGTDSTRVPYEGGDSALIPEMPVTFLGAEATFDRWAQIDGCTDSPSPEDSNGCSSYAACSGGVEVILCTKQGGREEPGDASIAWPVLKRHTL